MTYNCEHCRDTGRALDPDNRPYKIVCPVCKGNCYNSPLMEVLKKSKKFTGESDVKWFKRRMLKTDINDLITTVIARGKLNDN